MPIRIQKEITCTLMRLSDKDAIPVSAEVPCLIIRFADFNSSAGHEKREMYKTHISIKPFEYSVEFWIPRNAMHGFVTEKAFLEPGRDGGFYKEIREELKKTHISLKFPYHSAEFFVPRDPVEEFKNKIIMPENER